MNRFCDNNVSGYYVMFKVEFNFDKCSVMQSVIYIKVGFIQEFFVFVMKGFILFEYLILQEIFSGLVERCKGIVNNQVSYFSYLVSQ